MNRSLRMVMVTALVAGLGACVAQPPPPESNSGVKKATVQVLTGSDGLTTEQRNVANRLKMDNKPGSIKHLYVISPYSGQVIIYSTVQGKVTSSGKRLTPKTVSRVGMRGDTDGNTSGWWDGFLVMFGQTPVLTQEVLEDDGTYGSSVEYIYWTDVQGRYHQHFFTGGQILHVSDQPLPVKNVIINMELATAK